MIRLFISGILWHYTRAYVEILTLFKRSLWFVAHLFSIKDLLRTLFSPWQQLKERYEGGFHLGKWFESVAVNILMRLVGFFVRTLVIILGLISLLVVSVIWIAVFVFWTFIPFILVFLFITGFKLLFSR